LGRGDSRGLQRDRRHGDAADVLRRCLLLRRRHAGGPNRSQGGEPARRGALLARGPGRGGLAPLGDGGGGGLIDAPQQDRAALERSAEKADSRRGLLIALPAYVYLIAFFAIPFVIVFVYSFATRSRTGRTVLGDWNLDSYARLSDPIVR